MAVVSLLPLEETHPKHDIEHEIKLVLAAFALLEFGILPKSA